MRILLTMLLTAAASHVLATEAGVVVTCNKAKSELHVEYSRDLRDLKPVDVGSRRVRFWNLLTVRKCTKEEQFPGDPCEVIREKSTISSCELNGDKYVVMLKPEPYNPSDLQGECGAAVTGSVSIAKNGKVVLRELYFETPSCPSLYDETAEVVTRVNINSKSSDINVIKEKNPF